MYSVDAQAKLVHNTNWDVMFIIDACRFDMFEEYYTEVFQKGVLKKALSPASWTFAWLIEIFENRPIKDIVFVSSDYEVNSKGIMDEKIYDNEKREKYGHYHFDARKYFREIIDVWEFGVDEKLGLVHPKTMCDECIKAIKKYPKSKIITNFWQVHDPYIYYLSRGEMPVHNMEDIDRRNKMVYKWINLKKFIGKFVSDETIWKIRGWTGYKPDNGLAYIYSKYGKYGIHKGYVEDLKQVLFFISKVVEKYPDKKIVITSDHGELLGEHGRYSHGYDKGYKEIIEVPWFEI